MNKLKETKPIWFAVIWIVIYIILVSIGDIISSMLGIANSATSIILIAFSIVLILYLKKNKWFEIYGIKHLKKSDFKDSMLYIPLIIMAFIQYTKGMNAELDFLGIFIGCVLMICVGFLEELLFRGFLFQAILEKGSLYKAIIISGVTFGIGHVVNLLRGYSIAEQLIQIICAILIGIVLAYCVAITWNIIPGIIFHILFNISGTITNDNLKMEIYITIVVIVISLLYSIYLKKSLASKHTYS